MSLISSLLISIGLAMDAFAVSICKGLSFKKMNYKNSIIIGLWFGVFQCLMPVIGFFLGKTFEQFITSVDHWIAFILLFLIGFNMIKEALDKEKESQNDDISFKTMITLSVATSIDALAVGIAYVCVYGSENAFRTFVIIGVVTFIISVLGVIIGNKFGDKFEKRAEFIGGLILVLLGTKILLEHLGLF